MQTVNCRRIGGETLVTTALEIFTSTDRARIEAAAHRRQETRFDDELAAHSPAAAWTRYLEALGLSDLAQRARTRLPATASALLGPDGAR
ncbi:hypothetical protein CA982_24840 [Gordonia lacunae]|uniref:Uncharacterized protein n=1 Tax=Gordonia lacunae TaxID=417102 RepID=A0A243Q3K6_9ACTN|nr:hypothetical protein CA982_24840 [Gordonia lacunae]